MPLAAKPGQVVIFNEELPYIKLEEPFVRSRNKLTMQYLHYNNGYSYQTSQSGSISWRAFFNKVPKSLDPMVLQGHATN